MECGAGTAEVQTRVKRLEDQLKAFRFVFVIVSLAWASLIWLQARPKAILTATIVEAKQFNVVDEAGKTVAELSRKNGRAHLILYDASYKPVGEFSVVGSDPLLSSTTGNTGSGPFWECSGERLHSPCTTPKAIPERY